MIWLLFGHLHTSSHPRRTVMVIKLTVYPCICVYVCVRIYIYIIHACLYTFLKVGTENYWEWYFAVVSVLFHFRPRKFLFQGLQIFLLFFFFYSFSFSSFAGTLNCILVFYLLSPFRRYLERLINFTSSTYGYSYIVCNIYKES